MQLNQIAKHDQQLCHLLQQAQYFQSINQKVKRLLPPNIAPHFRVVCIRDGKLILHASSSMAATRLKKLLPALLIQLQNLDNQILDYQIKVLPENTPTSHEKNFHIPESALVAFSQTAQQMAHHPALHDAICNLVKHHKK